MRNLKTKYVNSIQLYYVIYLSVKTYNPLRMAEMRFFEVPKNH
jgi:hypothetical protein